jgi:peroxiredoxin
VPRRAVTIREKSRPISVMTRPAPPIDVVQWFNTDASLTLETLRGRVVVIEVFQMLCPGCVSHGLPQAGRVFETFRKEDVAVIGLHSVFEHHAAQTPVSLEAFLQEYRIAFPVGVDRPDESGGRPRTMARYAMQGTPTLVLVDHAGQHRAQHFGHVTDLQLGAEIATLIAEMTGLAVP